MVPAPQYSVSLAEAPANLWGPVWVPAVGPTLGFPVSFIFTPSPGQLKAVELSALCSVTIPGLGCYNSSFHPNSYSKASFVGGAEQHHELLLLRKFSPSRYARIFPGQQPLCAGHSVDSGSVWGGQSQHPTLTQLQG